MPDLLREAAATPALSAPDERGSGPARVAFLLNVIAPYHKPLFDALAGRYRAFRIFLSTPMEPNRAWKLHWDGLDVVVQKTFTLDRRWRHPRGFSEPLFVHLPVDTVRQLRHFRPQVVVSWEMGARTMLAAVYRWLHPGAKLLVWAEFAESTEHGRGMLRRLVRGVLHRAIDGFIVTGRSGARYLESIGVAKRKIHRISYTTELTHFAAVPLRRDADSARRLLYVGQLSERKGLLPFLRVLAEWAAEHPDRAIEFLLAGSGALRAALETEGVPENLRLTFSGDIAYEALPQIYARAGIFAFPTLADTWGVVVNEALAAGLPVLGSVAGQAVSELVVEGVNGWTFDPASRSAMRAALERALCAPPERLEQMREEARASALRITPEGMAELVDGAIRSCVGVGGRQEPAR